MKASEKRKAEMYGLIDRWRKSGKSQKEVCKEASCSYSVFKYWQRKQEQEQEQISQGDFIPINSTPANIVSGFEITYPNGVQLHFAARPGMEALKELIQLF